jgi:hypothetical protein
MHSRDEIQQGSALAPRLAALHDGLFVALRPLIHMRVLVVLSGPVEASAVQARCAATMEEGHELALCYVLSTHPDLRVVITLQQELTAILRRLLGASAEKIPVFVATNVEGDRVEDWADAWDATDVRR